MELSALGKRMSALENRQDLCEADRIAMAEWRKSVEKNTWATKENTEMLEMVATAFHAMGWVGKALKWIGVTGASFAAIYATFKGLKSW